jgi:hypothetical protein
MRSTGPATPPKAIAPASQRASRRVSGASRDARRLRPSQTSESPAPDPT